MEVMNITLGMRQTLRHSRVLVIQADGRSPQRASFEDASGGPIDLATGMSPQPPKGLSKAERKKWIRERTHIEQVD